MDRLGLSDTLGAFLAGVLLAETKYRYQIEADIAPFRGLLADPRRAVFVLGGRMSDTVLGFMSRHLRQARDKVHHLPADPESWPDDLLRMKPRDVLKVVCFYSSDMDVGGKVASVKARAARADARRARRRAAPRAPRASRTSPCPRGTRRGRTRSASAQPPSVRARRLRSFKCEFKF